MVGMGTKIAKKSVPNYVLEICAKIWARNRCRNTALKSVPKYGTQIGAEIRHSNRCRNTAPISVPTSSGAGVRKRHRNRCRHLMGWRQKMRLQSVPKSYGAGGAKREHRLHVSEHGAVCVGVGARGAAPRSTPHDGGTRTLLHACAAVKAARQAQPWTYKSIASGPCGNLIA